MRSWTCISVMALLWMGCGSLQMGVATSQRWHGGAEGSGGGERYVVQFTKPARQVVVVDKVWLGDRERGWLPRVRITYPGLKAMGENSTAPSGVKAFAVHFERLIPDAPPAPRPSGGGMVQPFDNPPNDLPAHFTHGAVVYCKVQDKEAQWVIEDFEALAPIAYP